MCFRPGEGMDPLDPPDLARQIVQFLTEQDAPVLFAGSGVSQKVGLPSWTEYIEHLASACDDYGAALEAKLIRRRLTKKNLSGAATVFQTCKEIPTGERYRLQAEPFLFDPTEIDVGAVTNLVDNGFTCFVTTNYDRVLHNTFASEQGRSATPVELDDGTLGGALNKRDFFIARIHGRAQVPESMVVGQDDYSQLMDNGDYNDFLLGILTRRNCLFTGFSFLDPGINHVLNLYAEKVGPTYPEMHLGVLPDDVSQRLVDRLRDLNINVITYRSERNHRDVWEAFRRTSQEVEDGSRSLHVDQSRTTALHRYLAFTLAAFQTHDRRRPMAKVVKRGIIESTLHDHDGSINWETLTQEVEHILNLDTAEASKVVDSTVRELKESGIVKATDDQVEWLAEETGRETVESAALKSLASSVIDRMRVREGVRPLEGESDAAARVLESVLLTRGWDLAAHFAGVATSWSSDIRQVIQTTVREVARDYTIGSPAPMERSVLDLLIAPSEEESEIIVELSRAAFAVQLTFTSPRQILFQDIPIPEKIYFDASILMPAITEGHPLQPVYIDTIRTMRDIAREQGRDFDLIVGQPFTEEIVEHRAKALERVEALDLNDPTNLGRHIAFYGALNTNVFIGAFGSAVGRLERNVEFEEFLREAAPYTTEDELLEHLRKEWGISVEDMSFYDDEGLRAEATKYFNNLLGGYETIGQDEYPRKDKVLIRHEAHQLLKLEVEHEANSLFATADFKLQRAIQQAPSLSHLSGRVISHLGLTTLVEVLAGLSTDSSSHARLMWGIPKSETEEEIRRYLIDTALREYEPALAEETPELASELAWQASLEADEEGINIWDTRSNDSLARSARFLDRFEDRFFENMRAVMESEEE